MADPLRPVEPARLAALADPEAADNYRVVLAYRDVLVRAGTIEGAYLRLMRQAHVAIPPVFIDQMVHLILRNVLADCTDPMRLRAAELFFREQSASTDDGRLMLADEEIVEMHARAGSETGLGQLLAETGTPLKSVALDVLDEDNKAHLLGALGPLRHRHRFPLRAAGARRLRARRRKLAQAPAEDSRRGSSRAPASRIPTGAGTSASTARRTRILNALYEGKTLPLEDMARIVGLFRMRIRDERLVLERVRGKPVYLGLAMDAGKRVKMKPQNLLTNLPLRGAGLRAVLRQSEGPAERLPRALSAQVHGSSSVRLPEVLADGRLLLVEASSRRARWRGRRCRRGPTGRQSGYDGLHGCFS